MHRTVRTRSRLRNDGRVSYLLWLMIYGALLILIDVRPGWESVPLFTSAAEPAFGLLSLALIVSLVAQAAYAVDDNPRLRAGVTYGVSLIYLAVLAQAWNAFPFDLGAVVGGQVDEGWDSAIHMILAGLFVWAFMRAARAAVRLVQGRRAPRLASGRASTI